MSVFPRTSHLAPLLLLGACSWFTDFKEQPKPDPWESASDSVPTRGNPQYSVSVYGTSASPLQYSNVNHLGQVVLPATVDSMAGIANPVPADERSLKNGRMYYQINCAVCHGDAGKGDGPITRIKQPAIFPPALVGAAGEARSDGYIFAIIRNGRGAMPPYNRIEELDRWDVVNYVRGLQGKYQVATGPVGLPGETGDKLPGPSQSGPTRPSPYYKHAGSQADGSRGMMFAKPATEAPAAAPVADSAAKPAAQPTTTAPKTGGER